MANEKERQYQKIYEGIEKSDQVLEQFSQDVLESMFSGSSINGDDVLDDSALLWTNDVTEKYFGRSSADKNSIYFKTIWGHQNESYNTQMEREWSGFMNQIRETDPGLYKWLKADLAAADDAHGRQEQLFGVYGPWVANERVKLSNRVNVNELSTRVWNLGTGNQGRIEQIVRDAIASGEPRHETYAKLNQWLSPSHANVVFGRDGVARRVPGSPNASSAARRLMRTETAKANGAAEIDAATTLPSAIGVEWALASTHSIIDVCDERATDDLYDLGPGIYEPEKVPRYPPHPNCCCALITVHMDEDQANLEYVNRVREEMGLDPLTAEQLAEVSGSDSYPTPDYPVPERQTLSTSPARGEEIDHAYSGEYEMEEDEDTLEAVSFYLDDSHGMNSMLRYGDRRGANLGSTFRVTEDVEILDELASQQLTPTELEVFRGMPDLWGHLNLQPGDIITDHGYVSTAQSRIYAQEYGNYDVMMIIKVPEGHPSISVNTVMGDPSWNEIILGRDSSFKITSVGTSPNSRGQKDSIIYEVEVVPTPTGVLRNAPYQGDEFVPKPEDYPGVTITREAE